MRQEKPKESKEPPKATPKEKLGLSRKTEDMLKELGKLIEDTQLEMFAYIRLTDKPPTEKGKALTMKEWEERHAKEAKDLKEKSIAALRAQLDQYTKDATEKGELRFTYRVIRNGKAEEVEKVFPIKTQSDLDPLHQEDIEEALNAVRPKYVEAKHRRESEEKSIAARPALAKKEADRKAALPKMYADAKQALDDKLTRIGKFDDLTLMRIRDGEPAEKQEIDLPTVLALGKELGVPEKELTLYAKEIELRLNSNKKPGMVRADNIAMMERLPKEIAALRAEIAAAAVLPKNPPTVAVERVTPELAPMPSVKPAPPPPPVKDSPGMEEALEVFRAKRDEVMVSSYKAPAVKRPDDKETVLNA